MLFLHGWLHLMGKVMYYVTSSQSLVNLLLVGLAITNVFDLDKDLGGISELGMLSITR